MIKKFLLLFILSVVMLASPSQNFLRQDFRELKERRDESHRSSREDGSWKWDTIKCIYEDLVVHNRLMQTWDSQGRTTQILYEKRLVTSPWGNDKRERFYYNQAGLDSLIFTELWNGQSWQPEQRVTTLYDEWGDILLELDETWESTGLISSYRYDFEYYYDSIVRSGKKLQGSNWIEDERATFIYNEVNYLAQVVMKTKQSGANLENYLRYTYSYDNNNNWTEIMIDVWQTGAWQQFVKLVYQFDPAGNLLEEKQMNGSGTYWRNSYRSTYLYDANGNVINGKNEVWGGSVWQKDVQDGYMYRNKQMIYHIDRGLYYYRTNYRYVAAVPEIHDHIKILAYPDPASDQLNINRALLTNDHVLVEVFSLQGEKVLSERVFPARPFVDVSSLTEGIYLLRIGTRSQKMIIHR